MTQVETTNQKPQTIQQLLKTDMIAKSAERTLGNRGQQFLTSVLTLANSSEAIGKCEPYTLYNACLTAATLDLPINQNLGFAYIVPYYNNKTKTTEAQFQMGYKGFIQLAIRSGKFVRIGVNPVHDGQLAGFEDFSGEPQFDFNAEHSETVVGYMAYFELTNGFRKVDFMSVAELEAHGKKYSQTYKKGFGVWKDNFDAMAKKTVIKLLLSKFAPLSTQMEQAIVNDQKAGEEYIDNKITFEVEDAHVNDEPVSLGEIFEEPIQQLDDLIERTFNPDDLITEKQLKKIMATKDGTDKSGVRTAMNAFKQKNAITGSAILPESIQSTFFKAWLDNENDALLDLHRYCEARLMPDQIEKQMQLDSKLEALKLTEKEQ